MFEEEAKLNLGAVEVDEARRGSTVGTAVLADPVGEGERGGVAGGRTAEEINADGVSVPLLGRVARGLTLYLERLREALVPFWDHPLPL